ncbi:hypothetical protein AKJ09_09223 [Labilithrix luteola]|uniref:FG-GAP repeat protein n=1 Tax=Labilithrix luteola TaxID=1391654 RepID=A0A0K1QAW2_9BACT|nr:VCBS repeat-containing protein [Labilithrix luteola]AKV02560.1 hypothetical protein AKJ09_09223 [Labilithrix luteola]
MRFRPLALACFAFMLDCASLDPIAEDTCGNGVVDSTTEDCDSFPAAQCGKPTDGASACRLLCAPNDPDKTCPQGWGCGVQGFCRQATGEFEHANEAVSAGVTAMLVGDFDGDRRKDILGTSALGGAPAKGRIHYFGDKGVLSQTVGLPAVLGSPVVRDFDKDARDDIAFGYTFRLATATAGGVGLILGQTDRTVVTKVFPTVTKPGFDGVLVALDATTADVPIGADSQLAVGTAMKDGARIDVIVSLDEDLEKGKLGYEKALGGSADELAGMPAAGRMFTLDGTSACGEVAVALNTSSGSKVEIFSPCRKDSGLVTWNRARPAVDIAIPTGESRVTGVFIADVDGDGALDLIVGGASGKVYVGKGNGTAVLPPLVVIDALPELPLATADLNGDGAADFVLPSGVLMSRRGAPGTDGGASDGGVRRASFLIQAPTKRWTVAAIADLNRDGLLDVVGGSSEAPDLDVLEGASPFVADGIVMPSFTISTNGPVTNVVTTDIDLDGTRDVSFVQTRAASNIGEIGVAFGRPFSMPPEAPRIVGRLADVRQLMASEASMTITTRTPGATASDLPSLSVALLLPSGERQPIAPLLFLDGASKRPLSAPNLQRTWLASGLVAAPAVVKDRVDLLALAAGYTRRADTGVDSGDPVFGMWLAIGSGNASFSTPSEVAALDFYGASRAESFQPLFVAGDIDGGDEGIAETVSLARDPSGTGAVIRILRSVPGSSYDPSDGHAVPNLYPVPGSRIDLLDVDVDGRLDLVALMSDKGGVTSTWVFFSDGSDHKYPFQAPVAVPLPKPSGATDPLTPLDFTLVTVGGDDKGARKELAIVTPNHAFRVRAKKDHGFDPPVDATQALFSTGGLSYGSSIAAGDFDGDGVEDLAVTDLGAIRVCLQKARLP